MELCLTIASALISQLAIPPVRATLQGQSVYTCGIVRQFGTYEGVESKTKWTFGGGDLWLQRMDFKEGSPITSLDYIFGIHGHRNDLLCWQLIGDQFYCVSYHLWISYDSLCQAVNLKSVPLTAIEFINANRNRADFDRDLRPNYKTRIEYGPYLNPVGAGIHRLGRATVTRHVFFDFWCRGGKKYEVYVTAPYKRDRLTRADFHPERQIRPGQDPKLQWEDVGEWTFDWTGSFYVAANGDDRYFVTDTGRVFVAPRDAKPGTPLKELWKGPPVEALIHDDDAKTWYAFTKDQFFEIADPIKSRPHSIPIRRAWTANEAVQIAAKCGRVIRSLPVPAVTERTWDDLASSEGRAGDRVAWSMMNEPVRAVALLKERLKPVQAPPASELAGLIDELGAASFAQREAAQKRLRSFGKTIEPALREASAAALDPERKRRLKQLLAECQDIDSPTPDEVRALRAVRVLERIGTPDARRLLGECAQGAETAVLTQAARKSGQLLTPSTKN